MGGVCRLRGRLAGSLLRPGEGRVGARRDLGEEGKSLRPDESAKGWAAGVGPGERYLRPIAPWSSDERDRPSAGVAKSACLARAARAPVARRRDGLLGSRRQPWSLWMPVPSQNDWPSASATSLRCSHRHRVRCACRGAPIGHPGVPVCIRCEKPPIRGARRPTWARRCVNRVDGKLTGSGTRK